MCRGGLPILAISALDMGGSTVGTGPLFFPAGGVVSAARLVDADDEVVAEVAEVGEVEDEVGL